MEILIKKINDAIDSFKADSEKNLNGNKAAGRRARVTSLTLCELLKEYRKESVKA